MADKFHAFMAQLDKELTKFPPLVKLEKESKVPKTFFSLGIGSVLLLLIFLNVGGRLLTNLVGFLYPAYASFKAIESVSKEDDVQWLTYWCVFGFLNLIEFFTDIILYWIPLYFTFKLFGILFLSLPQFRGAEIIYVKFLRPLLVKDQAKIDSEFDKLKNKVSDATSEMKKD